VSPGGQTCNTHSTIIAATIHLHYIYNVDTMLLWCSTVYPSGPYLLWRTPPSLDESHYDLYACSLCSGVTMSGGNGMVYSSHVPIVRCVWDLVVIPCCRCFLHQQIIGCSRSRVSSSEVISSTTRTQRYILV
jgi:hypothetical protein